MTIEHVDALRAQGDAAARAELREIVETGPSGRVRRLAVHALRSCRADETRRVLAAALRVDAAPFVRRSLVEVLAERGAIVDLAVALTDPVYRVRRQAADAIARALARGAVQPDALVTALATHLEAMPDWLRPVADHRAHGAVVWLARSAPNAGDALVAGLEAYRTRAAGQPHGGAGTVLREAPWFDDDPAVLRERLVHTPAAELARWPDALGALLVHQEGYPVADVLDEARWHAVRALQTHASAADLAHALRWLEDPRLPDVAWWTWQLLGGLSPQQHDAVRAAIDLDTAPAVAAFVERRADRGEPERAYWARRHRSVLEAPPAAASPAHAPRVDIATLGGARSPLAISGRFGLSPEGFSRALERGVDLFFWEPEYTNLTSTLRALSPARRAELRVVAGSFKVAADDVRRDLETTLEVLGLERLAVFLLFWVRSATRLSEPVFEALARARADGLVERVGLSTHDRRLAGYALEVGAQALMLRHNAAHRGAELDGLLGRCEAQATPVIAFNCASYGQLIELGAEAGWSAPDVYRYCLSQPGVRACLSAPRTLDELDDNLSVLERPTLAPEQLDAMRAAAAPLAERNREFARLVRWR